MQILKSKYMMWQDRFYQDVMKLPSHVTFIQETIDPAATPYDILTKTAAMTSIETKVKALWKRQFSYYERIKAGLSENCEGAVYIPPRQLVDLFGAFNLDFHKINIQIFDWKYNEIYVVDKVVYQAPMFDTCYAVELHLKSQVPA